MADEAAPVLTRLQRHRRVRDALLERQERRLGIVDGSPETVPGSTIVESDLRLECLALAIANGATGHGAVKDASVFADFVAQRGAYAARS